MLSIKITGAIAAPNPDLKVRKPMVGPANAADVVNPVNAADVANWLLPATMHHLYR
ncbi:hypothetical protein MUY27_12695 [Mucilaginibacter sp. RS28]|uniref:Uncharacterized protein n=1 Tax=Mucilaginibacter straminoryzae TaxID=2932774 RepID=A0A9X2B9F5_9SPHI|nr:hypothetical protein [Mucilaginibacter straminoryzae]MCJ8210569.1 hypothetical protein [Mucilaginibacter straminoryzae]